MKLLLSALQNTCSGTESKKGLLNCRTLKRKNKKRQRERVMNMKKLLFVLLAACCVWAAWDYSRPVEKYVVKTVAGEGDTLWNIVGGVMSQEGDRRDIHEVIFYTRQISNIKGTLQPGDIVLIPIEVRR
nr:MAG TPA: Chondroitinase B [Caudoviricetes sp.]